MALIAASTFAAPIVGGLGTSRGLSDWYPSLAKPNWNPPSWVFGPVWTALYIMMGVAAVLAWRGAHRLGRSAKPALPLYGVQLSLNALWSVIFFGLRSPFWALVCIVALLIAILACTVAFRPLSRPAAVLMLPYAAWVSFATALNAAIWALNR